MKIESIGYTPELKDLSTYQVEPDALRLIPESMARKCNAMPMAIVEGALQVAMADPQNVVALQELSVLARMRIAPMRVDAEQVRRAIDLNYRAYREIEKHLGGIPRHQPKPRQEVPVEDVSDAPVVRALDMIVSEAVKTRSSDVHIEPQEDRVRVRYRIDGVLHEMMSLPLTALDSLLSRIKVLASMDIADHRAQDGQFTVRVRGQDVDIRVATVDTIYGEMGSLRVLDKSFVARDLSDLGMLPVSLEQYETMVRAPFGMILVSGPTGSGKTTTLYASVNSLDRKGRNVITIEDPVEYRFRDINQIQVNSRGGLTFASGLRSIMRHDPDVVLVGEIRDPDTAQIAAQSALTGRLVLSSIHANDTVGCLFRLTELECKPFIVSSTVIGIVSQRMARRVCPHCKHISEAPPEARFAYEREMCEERSEFYYGKGCHACANTGYLGRIGIFEIMVMSQELRTAFAAGATADKLKDLARQKGTITMWHDGMLKVKAGITTPSEVLRNVLTIG